MLSVGLTDAAFAFVVWHMRALIRARWVLQQLHYVEAPIPNRLAADRRRSREMRPTEARARVRFRLASSFSSLRQEGVVLHQLVFESAVRMLLSLEILTHLV